ncbi:shikimate kinase [Aureimonas populi]|uniref:Shikimate kinase n=1 Tax=Aureimonas populi TaxID=1701758 RepID=A0ABW5CH98_9HYPH|nr:shikimate kinase [Aureimonas populi]
MSATAPTNAPQDTVAAALAQLAGRSVALVGLMGAGKTTVGRRLAQVLALPFHDSDHEIEAASRMSVPELFAAYGEPEFRALEARVISRLAEEGQAVISTGGGAYMREETRERLRERAVSVWLKADLDLLMERVSRRTGRPLLKTHDPRAVMRDLMDKRYPIYGLADLTVQSRNVKREVIAQEIVEQLAAMGQGSRTDGA